MMGVNCDDGVVVFLSQCSPYTVHCMVQCLVQFIDESSIQVFSELLNIIFPATLSHHIYVVVCRVVEM